MIFLSILVFDAGTFVNFTFTNYGMKPLSWRNAEKSLWVQTIKRYQAHCNYTEDVAEIIRNFKILFWKFLFSNGAVAIVLQNIKRRLDDVVSEKWLHILWRHKQIFTLWKHKIWCQKTI